jgi:hypothetical protein
LHRLRYSLHIGCRVLSGVKWVSNAWMVSILVARPLCVLNRKHSLRLFVTAQLGCGPLRSARLPEFGLGLVHSTTARATRIFATC